MNLVEVHGLSAQIGNNSILEQIQLSIQDGERVAIVGPSGSGKTMLMRCLMGLKYPAKPITGEIWFNGKKLSALSKRQLRAIHGKEIVYVPQNPNNGLDPLKRLEWQWKQTLRNLGQSVDHQSHIKTHLTKVGLPIPEKRFPHEWSRGMQQRFLIALATFPLPKLVILDEPTSALDPIIASEVMSQIQSLSKEQGCAILLVTHDLALASQYVEKVAVMNQGKIVEFGSIDAILNRPSHLVTQEIVTHSTWTSVLC